MFKIEIIKDFKAFIGFLLVAILFVVFGLTLKQDWIIWVGVFVGCIFPIAHIGFGGSN